MFSGNNLHIIPTSENISLRPFCMTNHNNFGAFNQPFDVQPPSLMNNNA